MASERIEPSPAEPSQTSPKRITDHRGNYVLIIFSPRLKSTRKHDAGFAPCPIQVYMLDRVAADAKDVEANGIPDKVGYLIERVILMQQRPVERHLKLYLKPQTSILTCLAHTESETVHCNRYGIWPLTAPRRSGNYWSGQDSFFLVIDRYDWKKSFTSISSKSMDPEHQNSNNAMPHW